MNGAQGGPGHSGAESNVEDIDGILGRFQDWSKARSSPPSANFGPGLGREAEPRKANLTAGTRELSYEQALRASSYRRPPPQPFPQPFLETPPPPQAPATAAPPTAAPDVEMKPRPSVAKPDGMYADKSGGRANGSKTGSVRGSGANSGTTRRAANPAAAKSSQSRAATAISDPGAVGAKPIPQHGIKAGSSKTSARSTRRRQNTQTSRPASAAAVRAQILASPAEPSRAPMPTVAPSRPAAASAPAPRLPRPQPAFRDVFQGTTELIAAPKPEPFPDPKSIALSLRVSDAEQARIQACAARANLSVSAYLRQCALGVDVLRDQVELALVALQKQEVKPGRPPGLSAIPGILGRFATQWFRRRRERAEPSGISLR
jgi:hypothetical protein